MDCSKSTQVPSTTSSQTSDNAPNVIARFTNAGNIHTGITQIIAETMSDVVLQLCAQLATTDAVPPRIGKLHNLQAIMHDTSFWNACRIVHATPKFKTGQEIPEVQRARRVMQ